MMKATLVLVVLAACSAAQSQNTDTLADSIRSYNDGVRWGRYAIAATKVPPRERSQFIQEMDDRANDVKITDYEVVDVAAKNTRTAKVRIKMSWYRNSEGTVHETQAEQMWERQGKLWFMVQEARVRGTEMPGLPEPLAP
jgi:hypothetical protein